MEIFEIDECLKSMSIIVDSREQPSARAEKRYDAFSVPYTRQTLDFGDYTYNCILPDGEWLYDPFTKIKPDVVIERKMNLEELSQCFCQQRDRFTKEFQRAAESGATVYLLVENASWENLLNGKYKTKFNSKAYVASITAWMARYNTKVIFCKAETSGKLIKEILYRELKEGWMEVFTMAYIMIDRKLFDHWIWSDKPFSKGQAWIDLIGLANHDDKDFLQNGSVIHGKRGCVYRSKKWLADRWGWSRGKTDRFLKMLSKENMIFENRIRSGASNGTVITIVNYGKFQSQRAVKKAVDGQSTSSGRTVDGHIQEPINNNKEPKKNIYTPPADSDDDDEGMSPEELMERWKAGTLYE